MSSSARICSHFPAVLIARDETDELVHLLVLVTEAPERTERTGLALVGSEQRLLLHPMVAEERDRERLRRGAELGHGPTTIERIVELLDQEVKYSVLAEKSVRDVHADVVAQTAAETLPGYPGHTATARGSGRPRAQTPLADLRLPADGIPGAPTRTPGLSSFSGPDCYRAASAAALSRARPAS
jgi:hypothetical protein